MNNEHPRDTQNSRLHKLGHWLWRRPQRWFLFGIPVGGFLAFIIGVGSWLSLEATVHATSTMEFCISCHEMGDYVFPEYQLSAHYSNPSGVRVTCADCHLPRAFFPKMATKIRASLVEVPGHLLGRIDTEEKFNAHKPEMAERVWQRMRATDSRECRECHSYEAMSATLQSRQAQRRHSAEYREATDRTCIDCHQGIAHSLPDPLPE